MQHQNNHSAEDYFFFFKEGEEQGFNYFFHLYYKPLVHFAHSFLKDADSAEDMAGDSFLKLWEKRETIASASAVKPYLYAIVRNRCLDVLRKQKHQTAYITHLNKSPQEFAPDITHNIIISESMHQVYHALQSLPSKYQKIFNMLYVEGKEIKEIALELNLPLSTVKSQKARVLELLKKQLPHLGGLIVLLWQLYLS